MPPCKSTIYLHTLTPYTHPLKANHISFFLCCTFLLLSTCLCFCCARFSVVRQYSAPANAPSTLQVHRASHSKQRVRSNATVNPCNSTLSKQPSIEKPLTHILFLFSSLSLSLFCILSHTLSLTILCLPPRVFFCLHQNYKAFVVSPPPPPCWIHEVDGTYEHTSLSKPSAGPA